MFLDRFEKKSYGKIALEDVKALENFAISNQRAKQALVATFLFGDPLVSKAATQSVGELELTNSVLERHLIPQLESGTNKEVMDAILKIRSLGEPANLAVPVFN